MSTTNNSTLTIGPEAPPLYEQLEMPAPKLVNEQRVADSLVFLAEAGYLTTTEYSNACKRLVARLKKAVAVHRSLSQETLL